MDPRAGSFQLKCIPGPLLENGNAFFPASDVYGTQVCTEWGALTTLTYLDPSRSKLYERAEQSAVIFLQICQSALNLVCFLDFCMMAY